MRPCFQAYDCTRAKSLFLALATSSSSTSAPKASCEAIFPSGLIMASCAICTFEDLPLHLMADLLSYLNTYNFSSLCLGQTYLPLCVPALRVLPSADIDEDNCTLKMRFAFELYRDPVCLPADSASVQPKRSRTDITCPFCSSNISRSACSSQHIRPYLVESKGSRPLSHI